MGEKPTLLYVTTKFRTGAIPNILSDILPHLTKYFSVQIASLEKVDEDCNAYGEIEKLGVPIIDLKVSRSNIFLAINRLVNIIKIIKPALVHSHLGRADLACAVAGRICRRRIITNFHTPKENFNLLTILGYTLTHSFIQYRLSNSQTVDSSWFKNLNTTFLSLYYVPQHGVIYNPVNMNKFQKHAQTKFSSPKIFRGIYVGKLRHPKGQAVLLDHFVAIHKKFPNHELLLVGNGPDEKMLRNKIRQLNLEDAVRMLGLREDIPELLHKADYFIASPISEGFSIAHLEAMASDLPIITSVTPAMDEYIKDGVNAIVFNGADPNSSVTAMEKLFQKPGLRAKILKGGRQTAQTFSPEKIAADLLELYCHILNP